MNFSRKIASIRHTSCIRFRQMITDDWVSHLKAMAFTDDGAKKDLGHRVDTCPLNPFRENGRAVNGKN